MAPWASMVVIIGWVFSWFCLEAPSGKSISTDPVSIGAAIMKIISKTSKTSTKGVMLMSLTSFLLCFLRKEFLIFYRAKFLFLIMNNLRLSFSGKVVFFSWIEVFCSRLSITSILTKSKG